MNILLLGAPGAGKGTQAKIISKKLNLPIVSMGDMLREMIKQDEELKLKALPYMGAGKLVPNEIVKEILKKRLEKQDCKDGFILDGYPRNKEQAELLTSIGVEIDRVIEIFVSEEEILNRLATRKICSRCGETFNVNFNKPKKEGVCDFCSAELVIRPDDKEETIKNRIGIFKEETKPLEDYYDGLGKLFVVDGNKAAPLITQDIMNIIEGNSL